MATIAGVTYAGPGWSTPPELWPAAVTQRRPNWRRPMSEAKLGISKWRATIRRESAADVATAIKGVGGIGMARCSMAVVNTDKTPTAENVICWMGPAANSGDDRIEASLIAAAPDLLAACRAVVASRSGDVGDVIRAMDMAEAAIRKATGGT